MGRTGTTWKSGSTWQSGKTTAIRVPIALKDDILDYARAVDSKLINDLVPLPAGDFLEFTLGVIDRYIEFRKQHHHPNQYSSQPKINSRAWDELRRFQNLIQESPELLG